jgi:cytochrome P450
MDGGSAVHVSFKGGDFEFLPFGSGRRMCAGMNFPMATVELMLANLVHRFDWGLLQGRRVVTFCVAGVRPVVRRKEKLLLVPKSRVY